MFEEDDDIEDIQKLFYSKQTNADEIDGIETDDEMLEDEEDDELILDD